MSVLESELSSASERYSSAVAESAATASSSSEQAANLRSELAAAKAAQRSAEASINDLKVFLRCLRACISAITVFIAC